MMPSTRSRAPNGQAAADELLGLTVGQYRNAVADCS